MRLLVTGGAGSIGSHLADRFVERGHRLAVLGHPSTGRRDNVPAAARFSATSLDDRAAVDRVLADFRPEVVDHHAAQIDVRPSVTDPMADATTNILGGIGLLES